MKHKPLSLGITKWSGIIYSRDNFEMLNGFLYRGHPAHFYISYPTNYVRKYGTNTMELFIIPFMAFDGTTDFGEIKIPNSYCLVTAPDIFSLKVKMFDRNTRISKGFFRAAGLTWYNSVLLEYFINAVIDPGSKYAASLERRGERWGASRK